MLKLTLNELAERVGMRPRTVRSYIEKDLLPGPATAGRYATYGFGHLERLKAIKVLREIDGLSIEETRQRLLGLGEREIREIGERLDEWRARPEAILAERLPEAIERDADLGLEDGLFDRAEESRADEPGVEERRIARQRESRRPAPEPELRSMSAPSARMMRHVAPSQGRASTFEENIPRRSRAEQMTRIAVTPDIDLVVRGVRDERQIRRLERIADYVRNALLRTGDDD